ncbi:hypothetical protein BDY17DRAFT_34710 [Neohortaea acidophila]|uniref:Uncharacterized protein n=1 Tax=Neohortaea acidophila TaxID=245834 RepID=A0A6A6PKB2_9PEZI|nr:uncharacterized protein BDY17DRAFT_34710 [Neohortaea acidophila]KAF2480236.1 hypothetical protein BDY17DRAFT_34710 [Neohortaea acidophila]
MTISARGTNDHRAQRHLSPPSCIPPSWPCALCTRPILLIGSHLVFRGWGGCQACVLPLLLPRSKRRPLAAVLGGQCARRVGSLAVVLAVEVALEASADLCLVDTITSRERVLACPGRGELKCCLLYLHAGLRLAHVSEDWFRTRPEKYSISLTRRTACVPVVRLEPESQRSRMSGGVLAHGRTLLC